MKDRQSKIPLSSGGIPIISPIMHCLAMPVVVFLRRNFGYVYLRPKSIFLSSIVLVGVLSYILRQEPSLQPQYSTLSVFAITASALYLIHLGLSLVKETSASAEHDQFSGKSHLLLFTSEAKRAKFERLVHMLVEPGLVLAAGFLVPDGVLGLALRVCGTAFLLKELLGAWLDIRWRKRLNDSLEDSQDTMESVVQESSVPVSNHGRTKRVPIKRVRENDSED